MNPKFLLLIFVWIAIIALSCSVLSDFWLPMLVGGNRPSNPFNPVRAFRQG